MVNRENKLNRLMGALKTDESLLDCMLEMIDTVKDEKQELQTGDAAEEAVVSVIHKTGAVMLQKWLGIKEKEAEKLASSNQSLRPHEKKTSAGTHLLET